MDISRRSLLRSIGVSAAVTAAGQSLHSFVVPPPSVPERSASAAVPVIHLDRNENPYGAPESVTAAMRSGLELANRFPEGELDALVNRIAAFHSIRPEQVILGCGSTEILRMCSGAFLGPGKKLVMATPGFEVMAQYAQAAGADVQAVPLTKTFVHDLSSMAQRAAGATGLIYVCNPHNPTGTLTPRKDIEAFIRQLPPNMYVVIDEAYHQYVIPSASYASFIDHPLGDPRVIVTRTFSKIYGLAGIRIGYGIVAESTARHISMYRLLNGVNISAARAARIALDAGDHVRTCAQRNIDDRQEFYNQANARMGRWIDSYANFVLLNTGRSGSEVAEHFRKNNILLSFGFTSMENYVRVTLGTPEEMKAFWHVWDLMPKGKMAM